MMNDGPVFNSLGVARGWIAAKIDSGEMDPPDEGEHPGRRVGWLKRSCGCKAPLRLTPYRGVQPGRSNCICTFEQEPDMLDKVLDDG